MSDPNGSRTAVTGVSACEALAPVARAILETIWLDDRARALWQPRFEQMVRDWREVQWRSVALGARTAAIRYADDEDLPRLTYEAARYGLAAVPMSRVERYRGYEARSVAAPPGAPAAMMYVLAEPGIGAEMAELWTRNAHEAIGARLGYPACCTAFFRRVWSRQRLVDPTWEMGGDGQEPAASCATRNAAGFWQANVLWRWLGIRAVPHLPCSWLCADSAKLGSALLACAPSGSPLADLEEWLSMPVTWSAEEGVAAISNAFLRVRVSTDIRPVRCAVNWSRAGDAVS